MTDTSKYLMRRGEHGCDGMVQMRTMVPKDATIIEIGCYFGESTLEWLREPTNVGRIICVDPYIPYSLDKEWEQGGRQLPMDFVYQEFKRNVLDKQDNVQHIRQLSDDAVTSIPDQSVDLVYIDGNHEYEYVKRDITNYMKKVKPGGILAGHDYGGALVEVTWAVDETIGRPDRVFRDQSWMKRIT
jgi:hypothetical protein